MTVNELYIRERLPVLNNTVYNSYDEACSCKIGTVRLMQCSKCGFVFNSEYDPNLISYDNSYDNARSYSSAYCKYLDDIVQSCSLWIGERSTVLEIGCGNGDFLRKLADVTGCLAYGFDNTYQGPEEYQGRVFFRDRYFMRKDGNTQYDVIVLRHVLEHIENPYVFLGSILDVLSLKAGVKLVIEVPSFEWIVQNKAFYDITYEHCNYFSKKALFLLMERIGFEVEETSEVFNEQYHFTVGTYVGRKDDACRETSYSISGNIMNEFSQVKENLENNIRRAEKAGIWGASGKGVIFLSDLSDDVIKNISFVIDVNPSKQGKYLPVSGKLVESPDTLKQFTGELLVINMNKVYEEEIRVMLSEMNVEATVISAA